MQLFAAFEEDMRPGVLVRHQLHDGLLQTATDCTSFVVMKERRIRDALTSDQHFVQAGFRVIPRS